MTPPDDTDNDTGVSAGLARLDRDREVLVPRLTRQIAYAAVADAGVIVIFALAGRVWPEAADWLTWLNLYLLVLATLGGAITAFALRSLRLTATVIAVGCALAGLTVLTDTLL